MQRGYYAPALPDAQREFDACREKLKRAQARLLVEKKIRKHQGARLRAERKQLRADMRHVKAFTKMVREEVCELRYSDGSERLSMMQKLVAEAAAIEKMQSLHDLSHRIRWIGAWDLQNLYDKVEVAKQRKSRASMDMEAKIKQLTKSMQINTTIHNAQSVQHIANFFHAQDGADEIAFGAKHVFEQVVRPWCGTAINPPVAPPMRWNFGHFKCVECRLPLPTTSLCRECQAVVCLVCKNSCHDSHCPVMHDILEQRKLEKQRARQWRKDRLAKKMMHPEGIDKTNIVSQPRFHPHIQTLDVGTSVLDASDSDASEVDTDDDDDESSDDSDLAQFINMDSDDSGSDGEFEPSDSEDDDPAWNGELSEADDVSSSAASE